MKIVSVLYTNFGSDRRVEKIIRSLKKDGHEVTQVAMLDGDVTEKQDFEGVPVYRIKPRALRLSKKIKLFKAFVFIGYAFKVAFKYRKADAWHCNDIEAFMIGILAKILRPRLALVYDAHELESQRNSIKKWVGKMFYLYEKMFTRFAHTVITVSPNIQKFYRENFKIRNEEIIYNSPYLEDFHKSDKLRTQFNIGDDEVVCLYMGVMIPGRGIQPLLDIFSKADKNMHIIFMGFGKLESLITSYADKYPNIHLKSHVPYNELLEYSSGADYGFQSVEPVCLSYYYSLPNKMFEYIHAGLPVISNDLPDCRALIEQYGIGYIMDRLDVASFEKIRHNLSRRDKTSMYESLEKLKAIHNWQHEEKKLLAIYNKIKNAG